MPKNLAAQESVVKQLNLYVTKTQILVTSSNALFQTSTEHIFTNNVKLEITYCILLVLFRVISAAGLQIPPQKKGGRSDILIVKKKKYISNIFSI